MKWCTVSCSGHFGVVDRGRPQLTTAPILLAPAPNPPCLPSFIHFHPRTVSSCFREGFQRPQNILFNSLVLCCLFWSSTDCCKSGKGHPGTVLDAPQYCKNSVCSICCNMDMLNGSSVLSRHGICKAGWLRSNGKSRVSCIITIVLKPLC